MQALELPPRHVLVNTLINEIEMVPPRFIFVLDDYYRIHEPAVHDLLGEFLQNPPQKMHLVIASRTEPPLALLQMRAYQQLAEVRGHDLRFTRDETSSFLEKVIDGPVDSGAADLLTERTEGWVTGLVLITLSLRDRSDLEETSIVLSGEQQTIDYLGTGIK